MGWVRGGGVGLGGQAGCDRRIEVSVKIQKKNRRGGGCGSGGVRLGVQDGCVRRIKSFCEN